MGDNTIHYSGHIKMMGAVQPFISGAISKTVNLPEEVTVEEVEQLHIDAWRIGLKAVAIYRDNCKVAQPLSTTKKETTGGDLAPPGSAAEAHTRELTGRVAELESALADERTSSPTRWWSARYGSACRGAGCPDFGLPGRRLRGVRDRRRVRGRPPGRGLHQGLEAGFHARRDHGRLLDLDQPRAPARGAARHLCPEVLGMKFEPAGITVQPGKLFLVDTKARPH